MSSPVPSKYKITTPYHKPGSHWACGHHTGVDFACPIGTPISAVKDGKVLEAKFGVTWGSAYGYAVIIDHGDGVHAIYAHGSELLVRTGQKVKQGQEIMKSGNSGNSTGPHLHFETRVTPWLYANKDINPKTVIEFVRTSVVAKVTAKKPNNRPSFKVNKTYPGKPIKPGTHSNSVKTLQDAFKLPLTGFFDDALKKKVIFVQKKNPTLGTPNGVVGPLTWKHIVN